MNFFLNDRQSNEYNVENQEDIPTIVNTTGRTSDKVEEGVDDQLSSMIDSLMSRVFDDDGEPSMRDVYEETRDNLSHNCAANLLRNIIADIVLQDDEDEYPETNTTNSTAFNSISFEKYLHDDEIANDDAVAHDIFQHHTTSCSYENRNDSRVTSNILDDFMDDAENSYIDQVVLTTFGFGQKNESRLKQ